VHCHPNLAFVRPGVVVPSVSVSINLGIVAEIVFGVRLIGNKQADIDCIVTFAPR